MAYRTDADTLVAVWCLPLLKQAEHQLLQLSVLRSGEHSHSKHGAKS